MLVVGGVAGTRLGEDRMGERRTRSWTLKSALAFGTACLTAMPLAAQSKTSEAYVAKSDFEIPVILKVPADQVSEMFLWMSADQGRNWQKISNGSPKRKAFRMQAENDGEYWFTLAYVRTDGRSVPESVESRPPAMKVYVDTKSPKVILRALPASSEKTGVTWTVDDENPKLETLQLRLKSSSDPTWHDLRIDRKVEGKIEWPTDPGDSYDVEMIVEDRAGNSSTGTIHLDAGSTSPSRGAAPRDRTASAGDRAAERPMDLGADRTSEPLPFPKPPEEKKSVTWGAGTKADYPAPKPARKSESFEEPPPPSAVPADENIVKTPSPTKSAATDLPAPIHPSAMIPPPAFSEPILPAARALVAAQNRISRPEVEAPAASDTFNPTKVDMAPERPSDAEAVASPARRDLKTAASNDEELRLAGFTEHQTKKPIAPPAPRIKLVGGRRFQMNYNVEGTGPAGVGAVELYSTRDNGQTWTKTGSDPDKESPMEVSLPGDGKYGLTVVVLNKAGRGDRPPSPGDQPQLRVDVDTESPYAVLESVASDPAAPRQAMKLSWKTEDEHPAERGVDLYFSHDPGRGWYKVAGGLPPTGSHSWKVPQGIPHQVYFCLVARDQAGNEEKIYSNKPVVVDLSSPQGKIDGILTVLPEKGMTR